MRKRKTPRMNEKCSLCGSSHFLDNKQFSGMCLCLNLAELSAIGKKTRHEPLMDTPSQVLVVLDMDHMGLLIVLLTLIRSSGLQAEEIQAPNKSVRLVGGSSPCTGILQMKHEEEWRPASASDWTMREALVICRELDCGSVISTGVTEDSSDLVWMIDNACVHSGSHLSKCLKPNVSLKGLKITCLDFLRLVNGTRRCSGRLEVRSKQRWSSVSEADFDQQDAEVVCRELSCGTPLILQGALYGEVESPMWTREFLCGGHESALLDCRSTVSDRNTSLPAKAVGLTCSEPIRLEGGSSRCNGNLELKQGHWRPVIDFHWTLKEADVICKELDCGSAVSINTWYFTGTALSMTPECVHSGIFLGSCARQYSSGLTLEITCSDYVRLVNGTSLCSGRLEVKSSQKWSSVCETDFDQQYAEVVCRELDCGAPSVLQGALYGAVESPVWTKKFQCGGNESALHDCRSATSARNTCSSGKAVGLTCSEPVRLVGGSSHCNGKLELRSGEWRPVYASQWTLMEAALICGELDCGSASYIEKKEAPDEVMWMISNNWPQSGLPLSHGVTPNYSNKILEISCLDSVRLVNGTSLCSGRLEVKSNQRWSSVCEADFDQQDAEVVCRELNCGAPLVLQGGLYGEEESLTWTREFQCGGQESALQDCRSSGSVRNTCSPGKSVGLTCSLDSLRLVEGSSHCNGRLEMKQQHEWRPVSGYEWGLKEADLICRELDCGSAISIKFRKKSSQIAVYMMDFSFMFCDQSGSNLRYCGSPMMSSSLLEITCSDSVRLVNGTGLCSGRLEAKFNQRWSSVCEADFDQHDAEVVCRELGCGAPSVLQGALYGEEESPTWTKQFHCAGNESALQDCRSSGSARNTCSPGKSVGLTCSEPVRLVGGSNLCTGTLEVKLDKWRPVYAKEWNLKEADVVCRNLDCGSAVSLEWKDVLSNISFLLIRSDCVQSTLRDCVEIKESSSNTELSLMLSCSEFVRLVNGTSPCSGRLEVKSNQSWSSVCEADFGEEDAAIVCREVGCGSPSVLQGGLFGDVESTIWTKEFKSGGHESALQDCRSSRSAGNNRSPGKAVRLTCSEPFRLVGGSSRCTGTLEMKHEGQWRPVNDLNFDLTLKDAAVACGKLDCGSAVSMVQIDGSFYRPVWEINSTCAQSGSTQWDCAEPNFSSNLLNITCSDSVRLVMGTSLCSGRLEVKSDQRWSSVCEADFDQQDAEVVCRELGCGAPSVLHGGLYGERESTMWTKEFQCGGNESALLDCRSSGSGRNTCSPGKSVGLICSEPVRLVRGSSRCTGTLEVKFTGEWRPVSGFNWTPRDAAFGCRDLGCGSFVSVNLIRDTDFRTWQISLPCLQFASNLRACVQPTLRSSAMELSCSDSVRLVNGTSPCSGRLEVRSNQRWSSVCEADFDQQDAEVICRELGCGAPSFFQGALYGEVDAPMWTKEFQCQGSESALMDCTSSDSSRETCPSVGLICSEPVRLAGGSNRCKGILEIKNVEWRQVYGYEWTLHEAAVICRMLHCGSVVSINRILGYSRKSGWWINTPCVHSASALRDCIIPVFSTSGYEVSCSDSVRLVNGTDLCCSGRLEVKSNQSNQKWSSVCEADFDQRAAEVVCRELGCGAPSAVQRALYGEGESTMWTKEFQCGGNESALLDCRSSSSSQTNTCSPGKAVGLTCSEPVRLVGGSSRCNGTLEMKYDKWKGVYDLNSNWSLKDANAFCRELDCGSAVLMRLKKQYLQKHKLGISAECIQSGSALKSCAKPDYSYYSVMITCWDLLVQPNISVSSKDGFFEAQQQRFQVLRGSNFTIHCSIQPQFPGGSFLLVFTSSNSAQNYTKPAVNHTTDFLFPAAGLTHRGNYSCVYHFEVSYNDFFSGSHLVSLTVSDLMVERARKRVSALPPVFIFAMVLLLLSLALYITAIFCNCKATRGQTSEGQLDTELSNVAVSKRKRPGQHS